MTGPQQYESVLAAVHQAAPPQHDPYTELIPPEGIKLTPRHYAYLKISEGCNNRCTFCIIPHLRGDLVSRPAADVLREAERLVDAGVKELLVISQDTSAYGVDLKYAPSDWKGRAVRAKFLDLAPRTRRVRRLGPAALRLSLPACGRGHCAHGGRQCAALSRRAVSTRSPAVLKRMRRPAAQEETLSAYPAWRRSARPRDPLDLHRRVSWRDRGGFRAPDGVARRGGTRSSRCFRYEPVAGAAANDLGAPVPDDVKAERGTGSCNSAGDFRQRLKRRIGTREHIIIDEVGVNGAGPRRQGPQQGRRTADRRYSFTWKAAAHCASARSRQ